MAKLQAAGHHAACVSLASKRVKLHPSDGFGWYWLAVALFSAKDIVNARDAIREASRLRKQDARTLIALGDISIASGDFAQALAAFQAVMSQTPLSDKGTSLRATLHAKIGDLLHALNRLPEAAHAYAEAAKLQSTSAQNWFNLGATLLELNRNLEAYAALDKALANGHPEGEACSAMGAALIGQREWSRAQEVLMRALNLVPNDRKVLNNLSIVCLHLGRLPAAEEFIKRKLALDDGDVAGWVNLGSILRDQKRTQDAFSAFETALQHSPNDFGALSCIGALYADVHSYSNAVRYFRRALEHPPSVHPEYVSTLIMLGNVLATLGEHHECEACFRKALHLQPDARAVWVNWFFVLNNHPDKSPEEIFAEYQAFDARLGAGGQKAFSAQEPIQNNGNRRIHIGYVSADFTRHSVQNFLTPLLTRHDRSAFEVSAFANMAGLEEVDAGYLRLIQNWNFIKGMTAAEVANLVREKQVDILVDLSGHTRGNRLDVFALHPAPVTVSWMGFGSTTGLATMDYYLADSRAVPPEDDRYFSEKPWRLERPYLTYRPRDEMGEPGYLPALATGRITFASLSRTIRFNDMLYTAWAEILKRTPNSVLCLNSQNLNDGDLCKETQCRFAALGIDPARIDCGFESPPWNLLRRIDISLDCFPHNSGTTLFESLYMGVPYITLSGRPGVGRLGAAILGGVSRDEWVAYTTEEYINKAVALASDLHALAAVRASLRSEMRKGPLMDEAGFARAVETAYLQMLEQRCPQRLPQ